MQQDIQRSTAAQEPEFSYDCFISYRRCDATPIARWLRRRLLSYRLPRSFRQGRSRKLSVYLDTAYERATDDYYDDNIAPALRESRFLMVVATPSANETIDGGKPNWVEREISDFSNAHPGNSFLAVRAAGQWEDPFPGKLLQRFPYLHIVDLRDVSRARFRRLLDWIVTPPEITALAAALYGVTQKEMPELRQEEAKRIRARLAMAASSAAAVLAVILSLGAYGLYQKASGDTARQTIKAEYLAWQSGVAAESPDLLQRGLLLAIEGYRRAPTLLTAGALHDRADSAAIPIARFKHDGPARTVRFSTDGTLLASGGDDGKLRLWDVEALTEVAHLDQDRSIRDVRFGPGPDEVTAIARKVATTASRAAPDKGRLVSWRWKENRVSAQFEAPVTIRDIVFQGEHAVGIVDSAIWYPSQNRVQQLQGYDPGDKTLTRLSPDSRHLAVVDATDSAKSIDVFDVATGARVKSIPVNWDMRASALAFDRDGKKLFVGRSDGKTLAFDLQSGSVLVEHEGHSDPTTFAVSPDNKFAAEIDGPDGANLAIWQIANGNNVFTGPAQGLNTESQRYYRVAYSEDSRLIVVCLGDRSVQVLRNYGDEAVQMLQLTTSAMVVSIALHPTRPLLAVADMNGGVTLWRLDRGRGVAEFGDSKSFAVNDIDGRVALLGGPLKVVDARFNVSRFDLDSSDVQASRFSRSGKLLALGRDDGTIAMVDFVAGKISPWRDPGADKSSKPPEEHQATARSVQALQFSADETQLIVVRQSGISTVDLATGVETVRLSEFMNAEVVFSPDGSLLAEKLFEKAIMIYSLRTFAKVQEIPSRTFDGSVAISPDNKYVAGRFKEDVAQDKSHNSSVGVWDVATGQPLLTAATGSLTGDLAFNASSEYLAFADNKKIQVWSLASRKRLDNNQTTNDAGSIAFHPTEPYLAAEYRDKKIRVWKILPEPEIVTEIPQDQELDFSDRGPLRFTPDGRFLLHIDGTNNSAFGKVVTFSPWKSDDVIRVACSHALEKGLGPNVWDDYLRGEPYRETCALPDKPVR
jgi:WD40 repeat protein